MSAAQFAMIKELQARLALLEQKVAELQKQEPQRTLTLKNKTAA